MIVDIFDIFETRAVSAREEDWDQYEKEEEDKEEACKVDAEEGMQRESASRDLQSRQRAHRHFCE